MYSHQVFCSFFDKGLSNSRAFFIFLQQIPWWMVVNAARFCAFIPITTIFMSIHTGNSLTTIREKLTLYFGMLELAILFFAVWEKFAINFIGFNSFLLLSMIQRICFCTWYSRNTNLTFATFRILIAFLILTCFLWILLVIFVIFTLYFLLLWLIYSVWLLQMLKTMLLRIYLLLWVFQFLLLNILDLFFQILLNMRIRFFIFANLLSISWNNGRFILFDSIFNFFLLLRNRWRLFRLFRPFADQFNLIQCLCVSGLHQKLILNRFFSLSFIRHNFSLLLGEGFTNIFF